MEFYTLRDFNDLQLIDKKSEIESFAVFIDTYRIESTLVSLYTYDNFYIEIYWKNRMRGIKRIQAITADKVIDKYAKLFNYTQLISDLLV